MQRNISTFQQVIPVQSRPVGLGSFFKKLSAAALVLVGLGATQQAWGQGFIGSQLTINATTSSTAATNTTTYSGASSANDPSMITSFNGAELGKNTNFNPATGSLSITLVSDTLNPQYVTPKGTIGKYPFSSSTFHYRVYLQNTTAPAYTNQALTLTSAANNSVPTTFSYSSSIDLFAVPRATGGGTYQVDIYFDAVAKTSTTVNTTYTDPGNGASNPYSATFTVNAPATTPAGATTTWQGTPHGTSSGGTPNSVPLTTDTDWNNAANWTNGVPTALSNAVIPATSNGSSIVYPILTSPASGTTTKVAYRVNNLTMQGNSNSTGAKLTINATVLRVYGDLRQPAGGLQGNTNNNVGVTDSTNNSTLMLVGANQLITGNLTVSDIFVAGSGIKSVINQVIPTNILVFTPTSTTAGVIIQSAAQDTSSGTVTTVFDTTGSSYIQLPASGVISLVAGQAETNVSYIKGVTRAERQVTIGVQNKFGNIGLDITTNHTPGSIVVYRVVGDALNSPPNSTAVPVKRQYTVSGDDNSGNTQFAGSTLDAVFHYLDSSDELNGIKEQNLIMFRTQSNGAPYTTLGGTLNTVNNTVTRLAINSLSNFTLTLGDATNPLPVTLAAFAATRSGNNALVTWTTATEEHNKGFNVQVSTDGIKFRTLGFVESKVVNSVQAQSYSYNDTEGGKTGIRYYRLEQVDQDGTVSYSQVRAVSFSGSAATSLSLAASPNPFNSELTLTFDGLSTPDGPAHVRLVDMTGRIVRDQDLTMSGASIALGDLSALRSGLYMAKVTLTDGTTKTVRIQRQ